MTAPPPVSVLLPVRDATPWLDEALASLEGQTCGEFEVLIQDDGSGDDSVDRARAVARRDPRFQVEAGPPGGLVAALRRARERAQGALLVRMDADDLARPRRLAALVEAARAHPEAAFFASRIRYFPREGLSEGMRAYEAWLNGCLSHEAIVRDRFVECPLPHPAWAIRAAVYDALGGYAEGDGPEDYDLFLRAVEAGVRFHKVPDVLLDWRERPTRTSRTDPRYGRGAFRRLKLRYLVRWIGERDAVVAGGGKGARRWVRALSKAGVGASAWDGEASRARACTRSHARAREGAREGGRVALAVARDHADREALVRRLQAAGWVEPLDLARLA